MAKRGGGLISTILGVLSGITISLAAIIRTFIEGDLGSSPTVFQRDIDPVCGFSRGFSRDSDGAANVEYDALQPDSVLDLTTTTALYGMTPFAQNFQKDVIPTYQAFLQSNLRSTTDVTDLFMVQATRYFAIVTELIKEALQVVSMKSVYEADYTKLFPGTPEIPKSVDYIAKNYKLYPADYDRVWLPYFRRIARLILPYNLTRYIMYMMKPFKFSNNARIGVAHGSYWTTPGVYDVDNVTQLFDSYLSELETKPEHVKVHRILSAYLPFAVGDMNPFQIAEIDYDELAECAWMNNGNDHLNGWQVTGSAASNKYDNVVSNGKFPWLTRKPGMDASEALVSKVIQDVTTPFTGYQLMGLSDYGVVDARYDIGTTTLTFSGAIVDADNEQNRFRELTQMKYIDDAVTDGCFQEGYIVDSVSVDSYETLWRAICSRLFHVDEIQKMHTDLINGNAVRIARPEVRGSIL
jgi:hypothetical protein